MLKEKDFDVYSIIQKEKTRQTQNIELIASENFVSVEVLEAQGSILTNKYAEGYPGKRYYGGCEYVDEIEMLAIERAKKLFNAKYVNVQPHSGSSANMAVYRALLEHGDKVMGMNLSNGGHLTHGHRLSFSGQDYEIVDYDVNIDTEYIDYDELEKRVLEEKPKMVSLSGLKPGYNRNTDQEHTAITNFSPRGSFLGGPIVETITDLLMMFAKTSDIQEAYGYGNCGGYDASLAPTYGVKQNAVIGGGQFYGTNDNKSLHKILHSVVLGSWQQWQRDPYEVVVNGHVKVSKNYKYDPTGATYTDTGIVVPDNMTWDGNQNALDYPAEYRAVQGYGSIPAGTMKDGTSSTGGCDGLWRKDPKQAFVAVCLRFGNCNNRGNGGPRARNWNNAAGNARWNYGASV